MHAYEFLETTKQRRLALEILYQTGLTAVPILHIAATFNGNHGIITAVVLPTRAGE